MTHYVIEIDFDLSNDQINDAFTAVAEFAYVTYGGNARLRPPVIPNPTITGTFTIREPETWPVGFPDPTPAPRPPE
jgi:hypothetical protein